MVTPSAKRPVVLVVAAVLAAVVAAAAAQEQETYALMVQVSPPDGGSTRPGPGVHRVPINETVTLIAVPAAGYRFVYWLGDVSNADTMQTTTVVTGPKIVVAVFERASFDMLPMELGAASNTDRSAQLVGHRIPLPGQVGFSGAGSVPRTVGGAQSFNIEPVEWEDLLKVPGEDGNGSSEGQSGNTNNVPEPATLGLLALGGVLARVIHRRRTG